MRWLWKRRKPAPKEEGQQARARAEDALEEAREETPEVRRLVQRLREQRERNHFSQLILDVFREER